MDFRNDLLNRIAWRRADIEKRNKLCVDTPARIKYELELLEDLLITYDNERWQKIK